jgi:hypothetical protein
MFHLDYLSCALTVLATILLARKSWIGLLVAMFNSLIVCAIALRTSQLGLIPANLICICIYAWNMRSWLYEQTRTNRGQAPRQDSVADGLQTSPADLSGKQAAFIARSHALDAGSIFKAVITAPAPQKTEPSTLIPSTELDLDRTCLTGLG